MNTPFKISFKRKILDVNIDKDEIFQLFLINSKGTLYDKIEKENDKKIIIKGKFYSFNPLDNVPWNLWTGFAGKAELYFTKDNTLVYTVDFTYGMIYFIVVLLFFLLNPLLYSFELDPVYLIFLAIVTVILLINLIIKILSHRHIFNKTLKFENRLTGNYDWANILKNKTNKELKNIATGNTLLTEEVQKLAKKELAKRDQKNNKL